MSATGKTVSVFVFVSIDTGYLGVVEIDHEAVVPVIYHSEHRKTVDVERRPVMFGRLRVSVGIKIAGGEQSQDEK